MTNEQLQAALAQLADRAYDIESSINERIDRNLASIREDIDRLSSKLYDLERIVDYDCVKR